MLTYGGTRIDNLRKVGRGSNLGERIKREWRTTGGRPPSLCRHMRVKWKCYPVGGYFLCLNLFFVCVSVREVCARKYRYSVFYVCGKIFFLYVQVENRAYLFLLR